MSRVSVDYHFDVAGLEVEVELLGTSAIVTSDNYEVVLRIPAGETDFSYNHDNAPQALAGGTQDRDGHWLRRSVMMLRATIELDIPLQAGPLDDVRDEALEAASAALQSAAEAARAVVLGYLEQVRTRHGQGWLGRSGQQPTITWLTTVRDAVTGEQVRTGYTDPFPAVTFGRSAIGRVEHEQVLAAIAAGSVPSLPEVLLADAKYLSSIAEPRQPREAVLVAAIACEVGIRDALRAACGREAQAVLEFALTNPRDVSVQTAALFDKAALAVIRRSLRLEDPDAYKAVLQLFTDRNGVAHRGETPPAEKVRADVKAADRALDWASSL